MHDQVDCSPGTVQPVRKPGDVYARVAPLASHWLKSFVSSKSCLREKRIFP